MYTYDIQGRAGEKVHMKCASFREVGPGYMPSENC